VAVLDRAGVPCGPVNDYARLFADPQVRHLGMVVHASDPDLGEVPHVRIPVRLSEGRVGVRTVAPKLGEHTEAVLGAVGYTPEEIAALRRQGAI
jgi:crotonobetainyl-CoA:carnitine CoA-transferase CaiB-like acyl-CoA transferase